MKTLFLSLFVVVASAASAQTIRIADNNALHPTGANIYTTIQAAVNAALPNDIVYVQPSLTSYGDVTIDRPITLRGIGFNTGKDLAYSSIVNNISLTNNSANTSNASGTTIEGLITNDIYLGPQTGSFTYTIQNITIRNCQTLRVYRQAGYVPAQNITVTGCFVGIHFQLTNVSQLFVYGNYLTGPGSGCGRSAFGFWNGSLTNCILSNNIVAQAETNGIHVGSVAVSNLIITNNIFLGGNNVAASGFISGNLFCNFNTSLYDAIVSNNIFYGSSPAKSNANPYERLVFANNISFGTTNDALPPVGTGAGNTGSGNLVAQDPKFVSATYNTVYSTTMNFNLQAGSPALFAGSDGTDIGITGGAYPVAAGNITLKPTSAPVIITLNPAAMVPQNQPINTNIKAKSN
jgi:hypothetical protein